MRPDRLLLKALLALALVAGLAHCSLPAPPPAASAAPAGDDLGTGLADFDRAWLARQPGGGRLYAIDPARSTVRIYAYSGGRAPKLGHQHVLSAPDFRGYYFQPADATAPGDFALRFELAKLVFDRPVDRAGLGPAFETELDADAIARTREHMLGEANFQARRFPVVVVRSLAIAGAAPKFVAEVALEIHGVTRRLRVPLTAQVSAQTLRVSGAFAFLQTDFGVQPYSVLGGLLAVQDEVAVEFELVGAPR